MPKTRNGARMTLVRPSAEQWSALPILQLSAAARRIAWLLTLVTLLAVFVVYRQWETLDEDAWQGGYRVLDMFGLAGLVLVLVFVVVGWWLPHHLSTTLAPMILGLAALTHWLAGEPAAVTWGIGAVAVTLWMLANGLLQLRQLLAVRRLARLAATPERYPLDSTTRRMLRKSLLLPYVWLLFLLAAATVLWRFTLRFLNDELGYFYAQIGENSVSDVLAAVALGVSFLAAAQLLRAVRRTISMAVVGLAAWKLPHVPGPVQAPAGGREPALILVETDGRHPLCACMAELLRLFPADGEDIRHSREISASDHCPAHGIDAINGLSADDFRAIASQAWLWQALSPVPDSELPGRPGTLLAGFAGPGLRGYPAAVNDSGEVAIDEFSTLAGDPDDVDQLPLPERAPSLGVFDRIELHSSGIRGHALRYRHGRAWFVPES